MRIFRAILLSGFIAVSFHCGKSEPPDLHQAVTVIHWELAEYNISRSMFAVVLPNGTPRQWVSYYFSPMGASEHAPGEEHTTEEDQEMAQALRTPLWPKGVAAVHTKPNPSLGKQIVLKWDDAKGLVIVEAFNDAARDPEFVREIPLPKVTSTNELAKLSAQSQLEMGASFQSF